MTELIYQQDAYARETAARVVSVAENKVQLDRTVFYPQGGGQPGDVGALRFGGREATVDNAVYSPDRSAVLHVLADGTGVPAVGDSVICTIDWGRRWPRMRIHTALHLLTAVLPFPVTGGSIGDGEGRLDFNMPEPPDRDAVERDLNALIARGAAVTTRWIADDELLANPGLVKTMSVKPPMGSGRVRLVEIAGIDLQPCGGTHVANTTEIGRVTVTGIESKGKQNRRVRIALAG